MSKFQTQNRNCVRFFSGHLARPMPVRAVIHPREAPALWPRTTPGQHITYYVYTCKLEASRRTSCCTYAANQNNQREKRKETEKKRETEKNERREKLKFWIFFRKKYRHRKTITSLEYTEVRHLGEKKRTVRFFILASCGQRIRNLNSLTD